MNKLGQAIIWKLKEHDKQIKQNTEEIEYLKNKVEKLEEVNSKKDKMIKKIYNWVLKEQQKNRDNYVL